MTEFDARLTAALTELVQVFGDLVVAMAAAQMTDGDALRHWLRHGTLPDQAEPGRPVTSVQVQVTHQGRRGYRVMALPDMVPLEHVGLALDQIRKEVCGDLAVPVERPTVIAGPEDIRPVAGHRPRWHQDTCHPGHPTLLVCVQDDQPWPCDFTASVIKALRGLDVTELTERADELEARHLTGGRSG